MTKNKLISLFQTLSENELRTLKQFVRSPFHNPRQDVIVLFDTLRKANFSKLTEESLFESVYPDRKFNKKELAYVLNYLMRVIEDYFAISELQKRKAQREFWIAQAALEHGQEIIFQQKIKKAKSILDKQILDNLETQELKYQLEMELYNLKKNQVRGADLDLKKPTEYLDIFLIGAKLRQGCLLLAHQNLSEIEYQQTLLKPILKYLEKPENQHLLSLPVISLHYFSYKTLETEEIDFFEKLKILLPKHQACFSKSELKDFYSIGLNFCIKQLNKGKINYIREAFEWYRRALAEEVLFEHGILSQFHYKNIAALGLSLKEYDWVENFLLEYTPKIEAKNRDLNFNYNMAKLHYEKGDFDSAMKLLQVVKYDDSLPNLTSKILLLKIYYELDEMEVLENYLRSFEGSVRRQRKLGYHKESYLNLISFMRKLVNLNPFDKVAIEKLKHKIEAEKILPEKKWLLLQIQNL